MGKNSVVLEEIMSSEKVTPRMSANKVGGVRHKQKKKTVKPKAKAKELPPQVPIDPLLNSAPEIPHVIDDPKDAQSKKHQQNNNNKKAYASQKVSPPKQHQGK